MARIIDRRPQGKSPSGSNRKKFLDRCKKYVKESIDHTIEQSKIKDIIKKREVSVPVDRIDEPTYTEDSNTGVHRRIGTGNDRFRKGDIAKRDTSASGKGRRAGNKGDSEDFFEFTLTKEEFLEILFEQMALPNYVKENVKTDFKEKRIRAGHTKEGTISQLNVKKTMESALGRRIAQKGAIALRAEEEDMTEQEREELKKKKVPFLEDVDLRYNLFRVVKYPVKSAVMFCLMDVSASMGEARKDLAKRFFLLLYLFLEREYDNVDIRFIRHTQTADEVSEHEFFYGDKSGGTLVSTCFTKMLEIIDEEYDPQIYNIYAAQASDGDNWGNDNEELVRVLENHVLPTVQYLSYLQLGDAEQSAHMVAQYLQFYGSDGDVGTLRQVYEPLVEKYKHFNQTQASSRDEVFPALRGLFTDE